MEIVKMVWSLAEKPNDDMVLYMLASTLMALDFPNTQHKHMNSASLCQDTIIEKGSSPSESPESKLGVWQNTQRER